MKVLVVGGGAREHALCWKLEGEPSVDRVLCAPGNAGIAGPVLPLDVSDPAAVLALAEKHGVNDAEARRRVAETSRILRIAEGEAFIFQWERIDAPSPPSDPARGSRAEELE